MRLKYISVLLASLLVLIACSENHEPVHGDEDEEHTYSFTAVLDGPKTRLGYQENPDSHDLKMVWDEGDVIRLYPDPSMNDNTPYYEFVANTGAGTSHTVFVHQGYILNWEHWKGKAIYAFPEEDNIDVEDDSEEFLAKAYVQKSNDNTEHLKYGEFKPTADGKKSYTGYWAAFLDDANLKMDHKMTFEHRNTVVYKIKLSGFLHDVPGGSQLRMSGDAWPEGEVAVLTLGTKDDEEPFLSVGEYGKPGYKENAVLTAYIIRQVMNGSVDGTIRPKGKLKFELLYYDKLDGTVMLLDPQDIHEAHRRPADDTEGKRYFTNVPWGDEYTWEVTASKEISYQVGDYVVADLTKSSEEYSKPIVAIDLGLPVKWAAFNVGAHRPDEYGSLFLWGNTYPNKYGGPIPDEHKEYQKEEWNRGDPHNDAAALFYGAGWRMPDLSEALDFMQYTDVIDRNGNKAEKFDKTDFWEVAEKTNKRYKQLSADFVHTSEGGVVYDVVRSKINDRCLFMPLDGYQGTDKQDRRSTRGYYLTSSTTPSDSKRVELMAFFMADGDDLTLRSYSHFYGSSIWAFSIRAVKE